MQARPRWRSGIWSVVCRFSGYSSVTGFCRNTFIDVPIPVARLFRPVAQPRKYSLNVAMIIVFCFYYYSSVDHSLGKQMFSIPVFSRLEYESEYDAECHQQDDNQRQRHQVFPFQRKHLVNTQTGKSPADPHEQKNYGKCFS